MQWFRLQYPNILIFAIPNGEYRDPRTASRLKAEGVTAGVPDLFIPKHNLWVEMKRSKGGTVSKEQKAMHAYLELIGHSVIIGRGFKDAKEKIMTYLGALCVEA